MKTVTIAETFTGYPNGTEERLFTKGETPELANDYADLLVEKGHARGAKTGAPKKDVES